MPTLMATTDRILRASGLFDVQDAAAQREQAKLLREFLATTKEKEVVPCPTPSN